MGLTPRSYLDQMDELHERLQQAPVALRPPSVARIGFIGGGMGESDQTLGPDLHCPAIIFEKIIAAQAKPRGAAAVILPKLLHFHLFISFLSRLC